MQVQEGLEDGYWQPEPASDRQALPLKRYSRRPNSPSSTRSTNPSNSTNLPPLQSKIRIYRNKVTKAGRTRTSARQESGVLLMRRSQEDQFQEHQEHRIAKTTVRGKRAVLGTYEGRKTTSSKNKQRILTSLSRARSKSDQTSRTPRHLPTRSRGEPQKKRNRQRFEIKNIKTLPYMTMKGMSQAEKSPYQSEILHNRLQRNNTLAIGKNGRRRRSC